MRSIKTSTVVSSIVLAAALVAGCSKKSEEPASRTEHINSIDMRDAAGEAAPAARMAPPDISPHAAPGVALNYRYAFVLPSARISEVQEQHASACEKLGPTQCRITGMRYSLVDEDNVSATLEFKLAPEIARNFGKDGIAAVTKAEGRLVDAAIEGDDVGTQITDSQKRSGDLQAQLTRIEQRLATGGVDDEDRAELQAQAATLRAQLASERATRTVGEERLANTPMTYTYTSDQNYTLGSHPFNDAGQSGWESAKTMVSVVLLVVLVALPWVLLAGLLLAAARSTPSRWLWSKLRGKPRAAPIEVTPAMPPEQT